MVPLVIYVWIYIIKSRQQQPCVARSVVFLGQAFAILVCWLTWSVGVAWKILGEDHMTSDTRQMQMHLVYGIMYLAYGGWFAPSVILSLHRCMTCNSDIRGAMFVLTVLVSLIHWCVHLTLPALFCA